MPLGPPVAVAPSAVAGPLSLAPQVIVDRVRSEMDVRGQLWVAVTLRNAGPTSIGVVYGNVRILTRQGRELASAENEVLFLAAASDKLLKAGGVHDVPPSDGKPYPLVPIGSTERIEDPEIKVEIVSAFADPNLNPFGRPLR